MGTRSERNVALDLLRVICMNMVVCGHAFGWGGLVENALVQGSINWYIGNLVNAYCGVAVNCFILISGYHLCLSQFSLKRIISTWFQTAFYSVGLYSITALISGSFSIVDLLKSCMVVTMNQYWFVTAYLLMYMVSPFLNCMVKSMTRRVHLLCCITLLGIFSVAHNLVYISDFGNVRGGSSFIWFCILYLVAAFIRRYVPMTWNHYSKGLILYGLFAGLIAMERFVAYYLTPVVFGDVILESLFYSNNSILTTAAAISLFMAMRPMPIGRNTVSRWIGFFAPLAFGVYLIHDHSRIRPILWQWLNPAAYAQSPWMIPYVLLCVAGIFVVCCMIEWLRQRLFRILRIDSGIRRICGNIQNRVQAWLDAEEGNSKVIG